MKLAHVAIVTPRLSGLYETTRELVAAERALGFDARMYDPAPTKYYPKTPEDRGALLCDKSFLSEADIIIDHSGCDGSTDGIETPHILVPHGRPRHSFLSERDGGPPIYSYHHRIERTPKYKAVVTFWPEHVGHLRMMFKTKPIYVVPPCVDLKAWTPQGPSGYAFHGKAGAYNVVCCDPWRDDSDPYDVVHAVALAGRAVPGLKLHIYGRQGANEKGWSAIFKQLAEDGIMGECCGWTGGLDNVYRAADLVMTCNSINTRTKRESMACGCPVLAMTGDSERDASAIVANLCGDRQAVRREAERQFNPLNTAKAFLAAIGGVP